jgi:hypothetical protein
MSMVWSTITYNNLPNRSRAFAIDRDFSQHDPAGDASAQPTIMPTTATQTLDRLPDWEAGAVLLGNQSN